MTIKLLGNEISVYLDIYDRLDKYKPGSCLYMYGRNVFGYVLDGFKYEIDNSLKTVRISEHIGK